MKKNPRSFSRGFTLVEVMVSMGLSMIVMIAVFSTYLYLGRNLTQLSYKSMLEGQSRRILTALTADIRNAKSVTSASDTNLALSVYNQDSSLGTVPTMTVTYDFSTAGINANKLTRNGVALVKDINDRRLQVNVTLVLPPDGKLFNYSTTSGNFYTTAGTGPTFQTTSTIVPMSVKQVAVNFTLQAGDTVVQGQQGTLASYPVASGRMLLLNHQLPDGT